MELRQIIIILGLVAIVIIVLDGLRRMKAQPRKSKRLLDDDDWIDPEEEARKAQIARELPNGGARIRVMTASEKAELEKKLNLRERVPMLMERVEVEGEDNFAEATDHSATPVQPELDFNQALQRADESAELEAFKENRESAAKQFHPAEKQEPTWSMDDLDDLESDVLINPAESPEETHVNEAETEQKLSVEQETEVEVDDMCDPQPIGVAANSTANAVEQDVFKSDGEALEEIESPEPVSTAQELPEAPKAKSAQEDLGPVEDLIVIHVMAKGDAKLAGGDILELLLRAGLRHGSMDIFHYRNAQGKTEFSLANCVQPGTFNPDVMSEMTTPGLTLFMQLPTGANAMESLDHMVEMAKFMARNLDAVVLDETHSTVTGQRIESYREKLRSFARKKLIPS